jgi:hypothetical protein
LEQSVASLSPEQAQQALIIFYDQLPGEFWEGGAKPSAAKIESTVEQLQDDAPEDIRPVVDALLTEGREEEKGEAAKAVLSVFHEQESLRGFVDKAVQQAKEPHLMPIPLIAGAVLVLLAALPKEVDLKKGQYKFGHLQDAALLMKEFAEFAGKLPAKFYETLAKGLAGGPS